MPPGAAFAPSSGLATGSAPVAVALGAGSGEPSGFCDLPPSCREAGAVTTSSLASQFAMSSRAASVLAARLILFDRFFGL